MKTILDLEKKKIDALAKKLSFNADKNEIDKKKNEAFYNRKSDLRISDLVKIYYKIIENKKERVQVYEGNIIAFKGKGLSRTFTVRKISYGVGVERIFPLYSPNIVKIELVKRGKARRSKLYYLRERTGKRAVIKEKINFKKDINVSTMPDQKA